jgi:hypothetical protein
MADDEWAGDKPSAVETAVPGQNYCFAANWERRFQPPVVIRRVPSPWTQPHWHQELNTYAKNLPSLSFCAFYAD